MGGKKTGGRDRIGIGQKTKNHRDRLRISSTKFHFTSYNRYKRLHCWYTVCAHQTVSVLTSSAKSMKNIITKT